MKIEGARRDALISEEAPNGCTGIKDQSFQARRQRLGRQVLARNPRKVLGESPEPFEKRSA